MLLNSLDGKGIILQGQGLGLVQAAATKHSPLKVEKTPKNLLPVYP